MSHGPHSEKYWSKSQQQFIVIHTVKSFGIVNKVEIDVFLELSWFFDDPADVGNLISGSSAFSTTYKCGGRGHAQECTKTHSNATEGGGGSVGATGREV